LVIPSGYAVHAAGLDVIRQRAPLVGHLLFLRHEHLGRDANFPGPRGSRGSDRNGGVIGAKSNG